VDTAQEQLAGNGNYGDIYSKHRRHGSCFSPTDDADGGDAQLGAGEEDYKSQDNGGDGFGLGIAIGIFMVRRAGDDAGSEKGNPRCDGITGRVNTIANNS
jgi:hypothetical protein